MTRTPVTVSGSLTIPSDPSTGKLQGHANTGLFMSQDHKYWMNGKGPMPSVTTILRVLDKPALSVWKQKQVAHIAWQIMSPDGYQTADGLTPAFMQADEAAFTSWILQQANGTRDNAAAKGTAIHGLIDLAGRATEGAKAFPVSPEYQDTIDAFQRFLEAHGGLQAIVSSEKAILNLSEGYAGTFDLLMHINGELWLLDAKSGKGVYADYALQLAAYGMAEHIALPNDPTLYPFPTPTRYGVLHLRPEAYPGDGYRLIEYQITDRERLAFLAACELWRWMQEHK